jgi:hypothetical protein
MPATTGLHPHVRPKQNILETVGVSLQLMLRNECGDAYNNQQPVDDAQKIMVD